MPSKDVVLVTGASRGIGKGVALAFGAAGATVYVSGRSSRGDPEPEGRAGSVEETAASVTALGGQGVAVVCDHACDDQVASLFARIADQSGRLDVLVNNAAVLPKALVAPGGFWERSADLADMFGVGLRSAYVASRHAAAMMAARGKGLIASISFYGSVSYFCTPAYGAQKAALDKLTHDMACDLRPYGVAAVSIWPGLVKTEAVLARWQGRPGAAERLARYETPEFVGKVAEALWRDPDLMDLSGRALIAAEYAETKSIADENGSRPPSYRETMGSPPVYFDPQVSEKAGVT